MPVLSLDAGNARKQKAEKHRAEKPEPKAEKVETVVLSSILRRIRS